MQTSLTRRLQYSLRAMNREARNTRTHFVQRRKVPPPWCADVLERVPGALDYLSRRLERSPAS